MRHAKDFRRGWTVIAVAAALTLASTGAGLTQQTPAAAEVAVLAASAGCGTPPTLTSGTRSISSGGQSRSYILRIPNNYDQNQPYRLIFGLHWLGGSASDVANGGTIQPYYGLQALANNSAIFVAPQGLDNGWANNGGRDVTFIDDLLNLISADLCVDTEQIFSLGFSYGGGMSYALACARADVFRAVAIYAGGVISGCSGGNQPIAYLQAHGISDNVLSISGARTMRDKFAGNNGCNPANPPDPNPGSGARTSFTYSGCSAGHPVVWYAFDGGHTPAPTQNGSQWLPAVTWTFFTQFQTTPPPPVSPPPPPVSPPPPPVSPPPPPPAGACSAAYQTVNSWPGGFQGEVTVLAGASGVNGWTVSWTPASGQVITQVWNGELSAGQSPVTVTNMSYNGSLNANAQTTFGFLANGSPSTPTPTCTSP